MAFLTIEEFNKLNKLGARKLGIIYIKKVYKVNQELAEKCADHFWKTNTDVIPTHEAIVEFLKNHV